jgi:hypothetical protein
VLVGKYNIVPIHTVKREGVVEVKHHTFLASAVSIFGEQLQELATLPID